MILLTGATGTVGTALLRRLVAARKPVRCLVRDPRKLGPERVRVQIALGDLGDPASFRNALRGVDTVVHLAAAIRDQDAGSIEELNGVATARLLRASERGGVKRFLFFSAMGASQHSSARFFRAKALAERAVEESELDTTVFAPSIVYSPGDYWLRLLERLSYLPVVPISGDGEALYQPIWADDTAACVMATLDGRASDGPVELAGPETLSHEADREARAAFARPPPAAGARAAARGSRRATHPRGRGGLVRRLRHLGGGGADGDPHDHPHRHRRRGVARGHSAAHGSRSRRLLAPPRRQRIRRHRSLAACYLPLRLFPLNLIDNQEN